MRQVSQASSQGCIAVLPHLLGRWNTGRLVLKIQVDTAYLVFVKRPCNRGGPPHLLPKDLHPKLLAYKLDDLKRLAQSRAVSGVSLRQLPPCPETCAAKTSSSSLSLAPLLYHSQHLPLAPQAGWLVHWCKQMQATSPSTLAKASHHTTYYCIHTGVSTKVLMLGLPLIYCGMPLAKEAGRTDCIHRSGWRNAALAAIRTHKLQRQQLQAGLRALPPLYQ